LIDFVQTFGKSKEKTDFSFQKFGNYFEAVFPQKRVPLRRILQDGWSTINRGKPTLQSSPVAFLSSLKTGIIGHCGFTYN